MIRYSLYLVSVILSLLLQPYELAEMKYVQSSVVDNHTGSESGTSFSKLESNIYALSLIESTDIAISLSELPSCTSNNLQKEQAIANHHSRKLSKKHKLYLSSQLKITPSLSSQDIVYPFHYFW